MSKNRTLKNDVDVLNCFLAGTSNFFESLSKHVLSLDKKFPKMSKNSFNMFWFSLLLFTEHLEPLTWET